MTLSTFDANPCLIAVPAGTVPTAAAAAYKLRKNTKIINFVFRKQTDEKKKIKNCYAEIQ